MSVTGKFSVEWPYERRFEILSKISVHWIPSWGGEDNFAVNLVCFFARRQQTIILKGFWFGSPSFHLRLVTPSDLTFFSRCLKIKDTYWVSQFYHAFLLNLFWFSGIKSLKQHMLLFLISLLFAWCSELMTLSLCPCHVANSHVNPIL